MNPKRTNRAAIHIKGTQRVVADLDVRRALVIGAHPDDNEAGCGGTIARLVQEGWDITFIVCTNGNKGSVKNNDPHSIL